MTYYIPAWQDTYYTVSSASSCTWQLKIGDVECYSGKAYRAPDETDITIQLNQIWDNYLKMEIPNFITATGGTETHTDAYRTFDLYINGTLVNQYKVLWDWSYENYSNSTRVLSNPINGHYSDNQYFFKTTFVPNSSVSTAYGLNRATDLYNTYACGEAVIYYVNSRGGIDSFLIEGAAKAAKAITAYDMIRKRPNTGIDRERKTYLKEMTESWDVTTGILNDTQSEILYSNLLTTNDAYIHFLGSGKVYPIYIDEDSVQKLTYRSNGAKAVYYQFKITSANNQIKK